MAHSGRTPGRAMPSSGLRYGREQHATIGPCSMERLGSTMRLMGMSYRGAIVGTGVVVVMLVAGCSSQATGPTAASVSLRAASLRPACPPDPGTVTLAQPSSSPGPFGPTLTLGASPVSIGLVLHVHPPSNMPDRYITEARLIMVTAEVAKSDSMSLSRALSPSNWPKGHVYDDPANQVAKAVVSRPGENQAVTLALPSDLPSGTYTIYYEALYPGPSLCGEENAIPTTSMGSIHQTVATVTVP